MVLISLSPFRLKRILVLVAAVLVLSAVTCFGGSALFQVESTPYDRQMERIQPILASRVPALDALPPTVTVVNRWMEDLRAIPYRFSTQWKTPTEIAESLAADCKGKAVALYQQIHATGAGNLRLVIGRRVPNSRATHTWLEWTTASETYVLDPTFNWAACSISQIPANRYVPYYAYSGARKYRAVTPENLCADL